MREGHGRAARGCAHRSLDRCSAGDGIVSALVQAVDGVRAISLLVDFETGTDEKLWRKVLDRESDGVRSPRKPPIADRPMLPVPPGEQFRFGVVVESRIIGPRSGDPVMYLQATDRVCSLAASIRSCGGRLKSGDPSATHAEPRPSRGRICPRPG
jgi:hypothetical protein